MNFDYVLDNYKLKKNKCGKEYERFLCDEMFELGEIMLRTQCGQYKNRKYFIW